MPYNNIACVRCMRLEEQLLTPALHNQNPVLDGAEVGNGFP